MYNYMDTVIFTLTILLIINLLYHGSTNSNHTCTHVYIHVHAVLKIVFESVQQKHLDKTICKL